jgi:hypothetical protein
MRELRSSNRSFPWIVIVLLPASFLFGCGSSAPPSAVLEGKVTVDGAPANSGMVRVTAENGTVTGGMIEPDGSYRIVGLPVGAVKITVSPPEIGEPMPASGKTPPLTGMSDPTPKKVDNPVPIPSKYGDKSTSGLTTTLKNGTNNFPIALSTK